MMSQSAGAGSPISFDCSKCRAWTPRRNVSPLKMTGRTKPYRPPKHSALGVRSSLTSYEYECNDCKHVGWSNHKDAERLAKSQGVT